MGDVGAPELLIILVVILVLFGGAKLPDLARSLGKAKKEFQKGIDEGMPGPGDDHLDTSAREHAPTAEADPTPDPSISGPQDVPTDRPEPDSHQG